MRICLKCHNFFKPDLNITTDDNCPINNCNGEVVEVDENIINVQNQLKKKGYPTTTTEVHPGCEFVEIIFDEMVHPEAFTFLPVGFVSEISNDHCLRMYKTIIGETKSERLKYIKMVSTELIEWIEKLSAARKIIVDLEYEDESFLSDCCWELYQNFFLFPLHKDSSAQFVTIVSPEKVDYIESKIDAARDEISYDIKLDTVVEEAA